MTSEIECPVCSTTFEPRRKDQKTCSTKCSRKLAKKRWNVTPNGRASRRAAQRKAAGVDPKNYRKLDTDAEAKAKAEAMGFSKKDGGFTASEEDRATYRPANRKLNPKRSKPKPAPKKPVEDNYTPLGDWDF